MYVRIHVRSKGLMCAWLDKGGARVSTNVGRRETLANKLDDRVQGP